MNLGGTPGIIVIIIGNRNSNLSSNPEKYVCISHSVITLGKGMHPIIIPPAMSTLQERLSSLTLIW